MGQFSTSAAFINGFRFGVIAIYHRGIKIKLMSDRDSVIK